MFLIVSKAQTASPSTPSLQLSPISTKALRAPVGTEGGRTFMKKQLQVWLPILLVCFATVAASAQSFRVQCPNTTIMHTATTNNVEPAYTGPTQLSTSSNTTGGYQRPLNHINGAIKCQQISGGDGFSTMGDGTQTYMFSFGPLSGLADIAAGNPGTQFPNVFNQVYSGDPLQPGDPATTVEGGSAFSYNGAVGLMPDLEFNRSLGITSIREVGHTVTVRTSSAHNLTVGSTVIISGVTPDDFNGSFVVLTVPTGNQGRNFTYNLPSPSNLGPGNAAAAAVAIPPVDGHVDPRQIMDVGVMNGNIPAPLMAIDEDDEFFLTLTNVGMIMRPDLFEQHTVHFHGYPNASAFYDGVPDASVAINIGGSFTYYYLAPDAGTYFWHCHITPPEHLQMGMVGQIYVRPRQNRVRSAAASVHALCSTAGRSAHQVRLRATSCARNPAACRANYRRPAERPATARQEVCLQRRRRLDRYDVEYPAPDSRLRSELPLCRHDLQPGRLRRHEGQVLPAERAQLSRHGHAWSAWRRRRPTASSTSRSRCPRSSTFRPAARALLRISDLDVTEYQTLASLGIPMQVIALNAKLLRDQAGNNMYYNTNSITLGGGESLDVILDASDTGKYPRGQRVLPLHPQS